MTNNKLPAGETVPPTSVGIIDEPELLRRVPISRKTAANWRAAGKLPYIRFPGSRRVLYEWNSVLNALRRNQRNAA